MFLSHVIGGKHLSQRADFTAMVTGATPDVVLTGVEVLARTAGDVVVVDVGGATTDVHSVVELDPEEATLSREVVASTRVTRTVEGDLGMRWSATSTVAAAELPSSSTPPRCATPTRASCRARTPSTPRTRPSPGRVGLALRRHAGRARSSSAPTVASSSAPARTSARSTSSSAPAACCGTGDRRRGPRARRQRRRGRGRLAAPGAPKVVVDRDYVLAAAGLLVGRHPEAAERLVAARD